MQETECLPGVAPNSYRQGRRMHSQGHKVRSQTLPLTATPEERAACRLGRKVQIPVGGQIRRRPSTRIPFSRIWTHRCSSTTARRVRLLRADWRDHEAPQYDRIGPRASTRFFGMPLGLLVRDAQQVQERAVQEVPGFAGRRVLVRAQQRQTQLQRLTC